MLSLLRRLLGGGALRLPVELRPLLASPPPGARLSSEPWRMRYSCLASVGDVVTEGLVSHGVELLVAVVDCATMRRRRGGGCPGDGWGLVLRARNPAGTITWEAVEALAAALSSGGGLVVVEGEEDLLALPLILLLPLGCSIVYGLPGVSAVVLPVTRWLKAYVQHVLERMERVPGEGLIELAPGGSAARD